MQETFETIRTLEKELIFTYWEQRYFEIHERVILEKCFRLKVNRCRCLL